MNFSNKKYAALYCRLSNEDTVDGESNSIANQKNLLHEYALKNGFKHTRLYVDDGYSGTTFDRPGFQDMLAAIESGVIGAVIVKDLSRFGRNYIHVGLYLEEIFPENNVRFISISENIDTVNGLDELIPFRNIMNELYAKEISSKIKTSLAVKGRSGLPVGLPPYGYIIDPQGSKKWVIDEDAAQTVRRIFKLFLNGNNYSQIAVILEKENILSPLHYWESKGLRRGGKSLSPSPYRWGVTSITKMLSQQEYTGDVVNFKTYNKSIKNKNRLKNDEHNRLIFQDTHEAIIDKDTWDKAQRQRHKEGRRKKQTEDQIIFTGMLVCSSCGSKLHYHTNQNNPEIKYFNCSNYNNKDATCKQSHYIRLEFLQAIVLYEIRRILQFARCYPNEFISSVKNNEYMMQENELLTAQVKLNRLLDEDNQQTRTLDRLYSDRAREMITEDRFQKLLERFNEKHEDLGDKIKAARKRIDQLTNNKASPEKFLELVGKYKDVQFLNRDIICDFIDYIEIVHPNKMNGERVQTVRIHFNYIGYCSVPMLKDILNEEILISPRKGVMLQYIPFNEYTKGFEKQ